MIWKLLPTHLFKKYISQKMQLHDDDPRVLDFVIIGVDVCGQHSSSYCRPSFNII